MDLFFYYFHQMIDSFHKLFEQTCYFYRYIEGHHYNVYVNCADVKHRRYRVKHVGCNSKTQHVFIF